MKRIWLAALASVPGCPAWFWRSPACSRSQSALAPAELRMPARKQQAPVPALLQIAGQ